MAIVTAVVPSVVPFVCATTESLCVLAVRTVDVVEVETPIQSARAVGFFVDPDPLLLKLELVRVAVEQTRSIAVRSFRVIADLCPTTSSDSVAIVI